MCPNRACASQNLEGQLQTEPFKRCRPEQADIRGGDGYKNLDGAEAEIYANWSDGQFGPMFPDEPGKKFTPYSNQTGGGGLPYQQIPMRKALEGHGRAQVVGQDNAGPGTHHISPRPAMHLQLPQLHGRLALQHYSISSQPVRATAKVLQTYLSRESAHLENLERQKKRSNEILKWHMLKEKNAIREYRSMSCRKPPEPFASNRRQDSIQILGLKEKHLLHAANTAEVLAPIRVSAEIEGMWLSDTLTWNVFDTTIDIERFAYVTCNDLSVPASLFAPVMAKSMKDQIRDFVEYSGPFPQDEPEDSPEGTAVKGRFENCPELRVLIKLDITIDGYCLLDQFEWDIACNINSPDMFANHMCHELSLPLEFRTAIAHSIREQTAALEKSLYLVGHSFDGSPIAGEEFVDVFLPTVTPQNVFREARAREVYRPLYNLVNSEPGKISKDLERDARRKRRQTCRSRRASALPHLIFQRTNRTSLGGGGGPVSPFMDASLYSTSINNTRGSHKKHLSKRQRRARNSSEHSNQITE